MSDEELIMQCEDVARGKIIASKIEIHDQENDLVYIGKKVIKDEDGNFQIVLEVNE